MKVLAVAAVLAAAMTFLAGAVLCNIGRQERVRAGAYWSDATNSAGA